MIETQKALAFVRNSLQEAEQYQHACHVLNYDLETICPPKGMEEQGEVNAFLSNQAFKIVKSSRFIKEEEYLYEHRNELEPLDQLMAQALHRDYLRSKNITPAFNKKISLIFNKSFVDWVNAKQASDYSLFAPSLKKVRDVDLKIISLRDQKYALPYDALVDEYERGMTCADLDKFFNACKETLIPLLKKITASDKKIRTDFLSRKVPLERQKAFSDYLLKLIGFDFTRGAITTTEHPFTDGLGRNDARVTTHYYENNFISNLFTVIHEGGHALFEQNQPGEDYDHFIHDNISYGMHESISRFYENRLARSRSFISFLYPKIQEFFGDIFADVSEEEMYEGINAVEPSLIRTEADELTYTFHIIIRYEMEKLIINEKAPINKLPKLWNQKYEEYLGIKPKTAKEGILQDVHWSSGFGYFTTYAIGNAYNAMYLNKMKEELDVEKLLSIGNFAPIDSWMKEHVFATANRLPPKEWIKGITGREFTPDDFLTYLVDKYSALYNLK
ncbi:MAG: carboxypeptidase M32 [Bacilli bacterium]|jgi:carboxypeptidase Taq|nr:carboxypeptidase M32 [Bacilli bacterium]